ncbi:glycoside hydrolase family 15 protein, partial [Pantoea allii]
MKNPIFHSPVREDGFAGLGDYAAIGEGRSVALIAPDGSIDWWCAPNLDAKPLFDRLFDAGLGGYFQIVPCAPYQVSRRYRDNSNVLETCFETESGTVLLTESINSTLAGRLPWCELARRIEGVSGEMKLAITLRFGTAAETRSPWVADNEKGKVFHIAEIMAMFRTSDDIQITQLDDEQVCATLRTTAGSRSLCALLVTEKEPLAVPPLEAIDQRIETSHTGWTSWVESLSYQGSYPALVKRSALSLKFLWYSPTGALAV